MTYNTLQDIDRLRTERDWTWTRIAASYNTSEREVRRWVNGDKEAPSMAPPVELNHEKILVVNDTQFPHVDRALWEVTCQIARDNEVTQVDFDGDIFDFEQLGRYNHNSYRINTAARDVERGWEQMLQPLIDENPQVERFRFESGNHEHRYNKYVDHNAGAVGQFPTLKQFLQLPDDWAFSEYGKLQGLRPVEGLLIAHGWRTNKYSDFWTLQDASFQFSVIIGHTHRMKSWTRRLPEGGVVRCHEAGHMCDPTNLPKSVEGVQQWSQTAGALVTVNMDTGIYDVEMCPVLGPDEDVVHAGGREYRIDR